MEMAMRTGRTAAIILAAGSGSRMQSNRPKQYMELGGKPILYYSLKAFEESSIDEIVLVVGENEEKEGTISVRRRGEGDLGVMKLEDFVAYFKKEAAI